MNHGSPTVSESVTSTAIVAPDTVIGTLGMSPEITRKGSPKLIPVLKTKEGNSEYREEVINRNTFREQVPTSAGREIPSRSSPLKGQSSQLHKTPNSVHIWHPQARHMHHPLDTHHSHHRIKRSVSLHEPSLAALTRPPKRRSRVPTQNFTLDIQGKHVLLYYGKEQIIDLTNPRKLALTSTDTVSYNRRTIAVISGIAEGEHYSSIDKLAIYTGSDMATKKSGDRGIVLTAVSAELFVSGNTAFYSRSKHFNALLNKRLAEIVANKNQPNIPVEFRVFSGGRKLLTIKNTSIIVLSGAEFRRVSDRQSLLYINNTLHIQDRAQIGIVEVFPAIERFLTLDNNSGRCEVVTHRNASTRTLLGGGDLYVHKQTKTAFYSQEPITNNKITEFMMGLRPSLRDIVFSIRFETSLNGGPLEVVVAANGNDILRLKPHRVIDQSVATRHHMTYANSTVYVMDGEDILEAIENIKEIRLHSEDQLHLYTNSSSEKIPGGGQLFTCQGLGLYSVDADLNDRIGDALLGAETHPPIPPSSAQTQPPSSPAPARCRPGNKEKCTKDRP